MVLRRQQRASAVVKILPGVHVEIARDWTALVNYCRKKDTRVEGTEQVHRTNSIPTLFGYAEEICSRLPTMDMVRRLWWTAQTLRTVMLKCDNPEFTEPIGRDSRYYCANTIKQFAYELVEDMTAKDIREGRRGIEFIIQNPLWITTFKNQVDNMILRNEFEMSRQTDRQTESIEISFP